jgi:hypothetical protein
VVCRFYMQGTLITYWHWLVNRSGFLHMKYPFTNLRQVLYNIGSEKKFCVGRSGVKLKQF